MSKLSVRIAFLVTVQPILIAQMIIAASFAVASDNEPAWRSKQSSAKSAAVRQTTDKPLPVDKDDQPSRALLRRVGTEIRDVVEKDQQTADVSVIPAIPDVPGMTSGFDESHAMQLEKDLRYQRLYDQVRALLDDWEQRQLNSDGNRESIPPDDSPPFRNDVESDDPSLIQPDQKGGAQSFANDSPSEPARKSLPGQAADLLMASAAIVDGPIDRLALANNLYATGQLVLALEMYEQIDQSAVSQQDRYWIEYQMACCLRKLKRISDAQARFRRLSAHPDAGVLNEMSRWGLDRITDRAALEADIQRFQKIIDAIRETQNVQSRKR